MGLLDVLNGMQNGPRGAKQPGSGGMSPMTMALIGLLAYKAVKSFGGQSAPANTPSPQPGGGAGANPAGGGLGDVLGGILKSTAAGQGGAAGGAIGNILGGILGGSQAGRSGASVPGGLGGLLNGPAGGAIVSGGLSTLIKDMQNRGQGKAAQSWVSTGQNEGIAPDDLAKALGSGALDTMVQQSGMSREELLEGLSQQLPQLVDHLTPDGRLPTETEAARMV